MDSCFAEDRQVVPIAEVPEMVIKAFVAGEDARFFQHEGLDLVGILRASVKDPDRRRNRPGRQHHHPAGGPLALPLAGAHLHPQDPGGNPRLEDRPLPEKARDPRALPQPHLPRPPEPYRIEAASQSYFGKSTRSLTLSEAAILAGLPKAPSRFSPYVNMERARQRQAYVLNRMLEDGYITQADRDKAMKDPVKLISSKPREKIAP